MTYSIHLTFDAPSRVDASRIALDLISTYRSGKWIRAELYEAFDGVEVLMGSYERGDAP